MDKRKQIFFGGLQTSSMEGIMSFILSCLVVVSPHNRSKSGNKTTRKGKIKWELTLRLVGMKQNRPLSFPRGMRKIYPPGQSPNSRVGKQTPTDNFLYRGSK